MINYFHRIEYTEILVALSVRIRDRTTLLDIKKR